MNLMDIHTWGGGKTLIGKQRSPTPWGFTIQGINNQEKAKLEFHRDYTSLEYKFT